LLCQPTHKTHLNYHMVADELRFIPPSFPKWLTLRIHTIKTYAEREHSILMSVTCTLYAYQVCYDVGRCVKDGSCSLSSLGWKL